MVQGRVWLLGIAVSIDCACLMILPSVTCPVYCYVQFHQVFFMDLPQYVTQYLFSNTECSSYLRYGVGFRGNSKHFTVNS